MASRSVKYPLWQTTWLDGASLDAGRAAEAVGREPDHRVDGRRVARGDPGRGLLPEDGQPRHPADGRGRRGRGLRAARRLRGHHRALDAPRQAARAHREDGAPEPPGQDVHDETIAPTWGARRSRA